MQYPATDKYDAEGMTTTPLEPGEYEIRLDSVEDTDKDGKFYQFKDGTKYALFAFAVNGFPNKLFDRFCFDETYKHANVHLGRFKQMLLAMRLPTDQGGDVKHLIGNKAVAFVKQRTYEGKVYNDIASYKPVEDATAVNRGDTNAVDDDDLPF